VIDEYGERFVEEHNHNKEYGHHLTAVNDAERCHEGEARGVGPQKVAA